VFVVDDDVSHLAGVGRLLRASGYEVETFSSASELLDRLPRDAAGCIVSDLKMPGIDGLELQRRLERSGTALPIVFLTAHGDIPASVTAMRGGAEDFLVKTAPANQLIAAIERALARDAAECETRARRAALQARFDRLTPREREVLTHVVRGSMNKQIAAELAISERSVKRHRMHFMRKLEADSVAELVRLVAEAGIDPEPPAD